jgi:hypothetical protein
VTIGVTLDASAYLNRDYDVILRWVGFKNQNHFTSGRSKPFAVVDGWLLVRLRAERVSTWVRIRLSWLIL